MIYSELFSAYYNAVAKILARAVQGDLDGAAIFDIVQEEAFPDSVLTIPDALKDGRWPLLREDFTTPIEHIPTMPLTTLQKRWLKSVLMDPRVALFDVHVEGLDDIQPLFTKDDYKVYDRYEDGDNFEDPVYRENFKTILQAIHERKGVCAEIKNRFGRQSRASFYPVRMEYSSKDDKIRILTSGRKGEYNLARVIFCKMTDKCRDGSIGCSRVTHPKGKVVLEITDERSALERVMNHFAHFEKRAEDLGGGKYRLEIEYPLTDETEMVIRILSFGQYVKVLGPDHFRDLIIRRLTDQSEYRL